MSQPKRLLSSLLAMGKNLLIPGDLGLRVRNLRNAYWPPAVESSIVVEDAVENRSLYRIFVLHVF